MKEYWCRAHIVFELESNQDAKNIYRSLMPELKIEKGDRSKTLIKVKDNKIRISILGKDINALRAGVNTYLRLMSSVEV